MSQFDNLEVEADVFLPNDNNTTKRTTWDYNTVDFTININILTLSDTEQVIFAQELATNKANVDSPNASSLVKGARIDDGTNKYEITNTPLLRKLYLGTYTIRLRKLENA
jgi:hypothetical protein